MKTERSFRISGIEYKKRVQAREMGVRMNEEDVQVVKEKIWELQEGNRQLKGQINSVQEWGSRLSRTQSLLSANKYKSNSPFNHIIEKVIAERNLEVLQLKDENTYLQLHLQSLRKQLTQLRQKEAHAPPDINRLSKLIQHQESRLEVLSHHEELSCLRNEEVELRHKALEIRIHDLQQLEESIQEQNQSLRLQIESFQKEIDKLKTCRRIKTHTKSDFKLKLPEDSQSEGEEEDIGIEGQLAIEAAVGQRQKKKKELYVQVEQLEALKKQWISIIQKSEYNLAQN